MEAARHQSSRRRRRYRYLTLSWLGIAAAWIAVVYVQVSVHELHSRAQLQACLRSSAVTVNAQCDARTADGVLEGALGMQMLITTLLFLGVGAVTTRKRFRNREELGVGLLTRSRPTPVDRVREDAGNWSAPVDRSLRERSSAPSTRLADRDGEPTDKHDPVPREQMPGNGASHSGAGRFRVPHAYTVEVEPVRADVATERNGVPSAPPPVSRPNGDREEDPAA